MRKRPTHEIKNEMEQCGKEIRKLVNYVRWNKTKRGWADSRSIPLLDEKMRHYRNLQLELNRARWRAWDEKYGKLKEEVKNKHEFD